MHPAVALGLKIVLFGVLVTPAIGAEPVSVTYLKGDAYVGIHKAGPWNRLTRQTPIAAGQYLKTGPETILELSLPDKSRVRLGPKTLFRIDQASFPRHKPRTFSAKLFLGRLWANVTRRAGLSRDQFKTRTPTVIAGVRGTVFDLKAAADTSTTVLVYAGQVGISPPPFVEDGSKEELAWPQEVTEKKWEEIILGRLQKLRVGPDGMPTKPEFFDPEKEKDAWSEWNLRRDALQTN